MTKTFELHVHPLFTPRDYDPRVERHVFAGGSLVGLRASMLYIYDKERMDARQLEWVEEVAKTRLIDDNPARVVYLNA